MPIKEGDKIPNVTFKTRVRISNVNEIENPFDWKDITTDDFFANKKSKILG